MLGQEYLACDLPEALGARYVKEALMKTAMNGVEYLEKEALQEGHLYRVRARNFTYALWDGDGFIGNRLKFGDEFLFKEFHYDEEAFATCAPLEDLGPLELKGEELLRFLREKEERG